MMSSDGLNRALDEDALNRMSEPLFGGPVVPRMAIGAAAKDRQLVDAAWSAFQALRLFEEKSAAVHLVEEPIRLALKNSYESLEAALKALSKP